MSHKRAVDRYVRLHRVSMRLFSISKEQGYVVTRQQAHAAGVTDYTLRQLCETKQWERVFRGIYRPSSIGEDERLPLRVAWLQLDARVPGYERRPEQGVVSHRSAAAVYGLGGIKSKIHHFTFPRDLPKRRPGVCAHVGPVTNCGWMDGILISQPLQVVAELLADNEELSVVQLVIRDILRRHYADPAAIAEVLLRVEVEGIERLRTWFDQASESDGTISWLSGGVPSAQVSVLLGAGASIDAGVPAAYAMTADVLRKLAHWPEAPLLRHLHDALSARPVPTRMWERFQLSPVAFERAKRARGRVDVERLFSAIELLSDRGRQPWSPFVTHWEDEFQRLAAHVPPVAREPNSQLEVFESMIASGRDDLVDPDDYADAVMADWTPRTDPWRSDIDRTLAVLKNAMTFALLQALQIVDRARVDYLAPLFELARGDENLTIATLCYDRSCEFAAARADVRCDTGVRRIAGTEVIDPRALDRRPDAGTRVSLYKLHGSIDWAYKAEAGGMYFSSRLPAREVLRFRGGPGDMAHAGMRPALVFGEHGKLRGDGPFLGLLNGWTARLDEASVLLVIGYSFRDAHINEAIGRWYNADRRRRIVVLEPDLMLDPEPDTFFDHIVYHARGFHPARVQQVRGTAREKLSEAVDLALNAHTALPWDSSRVSWPTVRRRGNGVPPAAEDATP